MTALAGSAGKLPAQTSDAIVPQIILFSGVEDVISYAAQPWTAICGCCAVQERIVASKQQYSMQYMKPDVTPEKDSQEAITEDSSSRQVQP